MIAEPNDVQSDVVCCGVWSAVLWRVACSILCRGCCSLCRVCSSASNAADYRFLELSGPEADHGMARLTHPCAVCSAVIPEQSSLRGIKCDHPCATAVIPTWYTLRSFLRGIPYGHCCAFLPTWYTLRSSLHGTLQSSIAAGQGCACYPCLTRLVTATAEKFGRR